jgi:MOB kinase activator 1
VNKGTGRVVRNDFFELVQLPQGVSRADWLISNAVDFLERTELLFSSCSLFCTYTTCPMFNAGPHYHYLREDDDTEQPVQLSAPEYFNALKHWVKRALSNEKLFPWTPGAELSSEALDALKTTYLRLFRIMAHMYMCHFADIQKQKQSMEPVINTVLGHYSTFAPPLQAHRTERAGDARTSLRRDVEDARHSLRSSKINSPNLLFLMVPLIRIRISFVVLMVPLARIAISVVFYGFV